MKKYDDLTGAKSRITITLPTDLLHHVDRTVNHRVIRNRSHAVELLIRKSINPQLSTAVILAGGLGEKKKPPALTLIGKQKLISHMLEHLRYFGISHIIVLPGKNHSAIKTEVESGKNFGMRITYIDEPKPLGTAGALKSAAKHLRDEPFLVFHGDVLTNINLRDFITFHQQERTIATIAVKPRNSEKKYGRVLLKGNKITDFLKSDRGIGASIVNTGVYIFEPEVLNLITENSCVQLETDVFPQLSKLGELSAYLFQGIWFDISRPENRRQAIHRWQQAQKEKETTKGGDWDGI